MISKLRLLQPTKRWEFVYIVSPYRHVRICSFLFQGTLLDCMNMLTYLGPDDLDCAHPHTEMGSSGLWSSPHRDGRLWAMVIPRDGRLWAVVIPIRDGNLWAVVISTQRWWPSQIKCLSFADWVLPGLSHQLFCLYLLHTFAYFLFTSV